jgi:hypothetical protein
MPDGHTLVQTDYAHTEQSSRQHGTKKLVERFGERLVPVRIAFHEADLRERAKRLGAVWRPMPKTTAPPRCRAAQSTWCGRKPTR